MNEQLLHQALYVLKNSAPCTLDGDYEYAERLWVRYEDTIDALEKALAQSGSVVVVKNEQPRSAGPDELYQIFGGSK